MNTFSDRQKSQEAKYAFDEENKFRILARRNRLLGEWAASLLGKTEEESVLYSRSIVDAGVRGDAALREKLQEDLAALPHVGLIDTHINALGAEAARQIDEERQVGL